MKRDERGRTRFERLLDEAKRQRRVEIVVAFTLGVAVGLFIGWLA